MNNATSLLDKLNKINDENTISIFVPSLNKEVNFKSLNIKQQKDLIKTAMDGAAAGATLNQQLNEIVTSNSIEKADFKIYDRYAIILGLRSATIGDSFTLNNNEINLSKVLKQNIVEFKQKKVNSSKKIEFSSIRVSLELPSLERDTKINEKFVRFAKMRENSDNYSEAIGNLYIYEIIKFIKTIQIDGDAEAYDFDNISIKDCFAIVESLPVSLNIKIIEYIESIREIENGFLQTENGNIEINAAFFTKA